jgi:hypothetical protein
MHQNTGGHTGVIYTQNTKEHLPQAVLDVIVRDIINVLMFSLQVPKYVTFEEWYHRFMKVIEDLNLIYGPISSATRREFFLCTLLSVRSASDV